MHRLLTTIALATFFAISAGASERTDVMSVVHQWIDALNKGDMKSFVALCAEQTSILDDTYPYQWQGAGACSNWWRNNEADNKNNEITDMFITLGKPLQLDVTADHAYVVTRDGLAYKLKGKPMKQTGSIHTFVLQKSNSGWRITGEAWAATVSAMPAK